MGLTAPVRILRAELAALDDLAAKGVAECQITLAPIRQIVDQMAAIEQERGEIMDALECLEAGGFEIGDWRPFRGVGLIFAKADRTPDLFGAPLIGGA